MKNNYFITETKYENVTFYGIVLESEGELHRADEITTDPHKAKELCNLMKHGEVTEVTFYDIIQDFME